MGDLSDDWDIVRNGKKKDVIVKERKGNNGGGMMMMGNNAAANSDEKNRYVSISGESHMDLTVGGVSGFQTLMLSYYRRAQGKVTDETLTVEWRSHDNNVWSAWNLLETATKASRGSNGGVELVLPTDTDEVQIRFATTGSNKKKSGYDLDDISVTGSG